MSTARMIIEAKRAAFIEGYMARRGRDSGAGRALAELKAEKKYPIPTVEVPRVLRLSLEKVPHIPGVDWVEYKIENGVMMTRSPYYIRHMGGGGITKWKPSRYTPEHIHQILELYERPTEVREIP